MPRKKRSPDELTKPEAKLLARIQGGALCCEIVGKTRRWFTEPGGRSAGSQTVAKLLHRGVIRANTAGLFQANDSQSFKAVS